MTPRTSSPKIFGMRLGIDPKYLVGGLVALALLLFWYNSRGDNETGGGSLSPAPSPAATSGSSTAFEASNSSDVPAGTAIRTVPRRLRGTPNDRGVLRLRPVNGSRGDVDPTLHLDLLTRLRNASAPSGGRSLFTTGPTPEQQAQAAAMVAHSPVIPLRPVTPPPTQPVAMAPMTPQVNIPLRFYGFARPAAKGETNRGLFMDNDNVVVASEGQLIKNRYLVVELTPNSAKMEDTQMKAGQTLPVVPEAMPQGQ